MEPSVQQPTHGVFDESLFQYEDGTQATPVSLVSEGFLTDFEGTSAGFRIRRTRRHAVQWHRVGTRHPFIHRHPCRCASGAECWGTNLADTNYTDDNDDGNTPPSYLPFVVSMTSASCLSTRSSRARPPTSIPGTTSKRPLAPNRTASGFPTAVTSNPLFAKSRLPARQQRLQLHRHRPACQYGPRLRRQLRTRRRVWKQLGRQNLEQLRWPAERQQLGVGPCGFLDHAQNPSGWANIAVDLTDFIDEYVQIRFVLHHTARPAMNIDDNMSGWYVDNFRLGICCPKAPA